MGEETEKQTNKVGVVATVSKRSRHRKKLLYQELKKQMEFYFSDVNITKNRLMQELFQQSPTGVDLSVFLKFNKIKAMTTSIKDIAKALQSSELLNVSECGTKVFRTTPPQQKLYSDECTIYVEQIPFDADHNWIQSIFQAYGPVDYISIPKFKHSHKNKGFAFVEFKDIQSAKNALTAFTEIGCCLSTQMDPGQLYSVKSFTENEETRPDDENKAINRKRKLSETKSNKDDAEEEREDEVGQKKVKTENRSSPLNPHNDNEHESLPDPCQESSLSAEKNDLESAADDDNEDEGDVDGDEKRKKNRKRKKKHKRNKSSDHSYGLQILSKAEWKWLRNKYLNQQREKMKELKQFIRHNNRQAQHQPPPIQHNSDTTKIEISNRLTLTPGLIVRVQLDEPVMSKASFKSEAKMYPEIKYIDVSEGSHTVFMRFSDASAAQQCVESNHWKTATVITGEEEKLYWDKIAEERRVKLSKGNKQAGDHRQKSKKGREKLLKKAEQMHHKHIWFD